MAFNFNWSPLTADADFYKRAQEMLTTALNKSPKPPIIVDDILVNELNLGSVPPELEILEIGDLAEDRFRGIFKMCYSGDAFLTLKTRVQVRSQPYIHYTPPGFLWPLCYRMRWHCKLFRERIRVEKLLHLAISDGLIYKQHRRTP
jgi:distribution and morphology protein 34